jgi:sec-independent protein translocase protein TatA
MGTFSIWHWLIVLAVVLVLFGGGGKLSRLMGDFGKGLKSFKKQMRDEKDDETEPKTIANEQSPGQAARPEEPDSREPARRESDKAAKG